MMRTTYQDLEPVSAEEDEEGGTAGWVWAVVIAALVVVAGVIVWLLRRPKKVEVE